MSDLVILDYNDLLIDPYEATEEANVKMSMLLEKAYGRGDDSLGVLAIRRIPGFVERKQRFLPMAHALAHLPHSFLEGKLTDEPSFYNAGWSHGKEKLGGTPDTSKGSYYFNPVTDCPGSDADRAQYPASYPCNIWPAEDTLPGFQDAAKSIGVLMHQVVVYLTKHVDQFVSSKCSHYPRDLLYSLMAPTEKVKGRLLYYFPLEIQDAQDCSEDSWIGWHNDSGFLTALAGEMYVNDVTGERIVNPDPRAGLYVTTRKGERIQVHIPEDCMAVQLGECVQISTGGLLVATPHCVRGVDPRVVAPSAKGDAVRVARISLPCFVDSVPNFPLSVPNGCSREAVLSSGVENDKVPPLSKRWTEDGMTFGNFLQKSFELYYSWSADDAQESERS